MVVGCRSSWPLLVAGRGCSPAVLRAVAMLGWTGSLVSSFPVRARLRADLGCPQAVRVLWRCSEGARGVLGGCSEGTQAPHSQSLQPVSVLGILSLPSRGRLSALDACDPSLPACVRGVVLLTALPLG